MPPACSDCVEEYDPSEFARVVDVNLTGTMRMSVACRPALANAKGAIVNIASMHAIFGAPLSPAYAASKAGVVQLTKSLAVAWAEDGIRVNAIAPGWIETPMTEPARSDDARNRAILERTPLGRWGTPDDIVGPALFLASDAARFITGAVLAGRRRLFREMRRSEACPSLMPTPIHASPTASRSPLRWHPISWWRRCCRRTNASGYRRRRTSGSGRSACRRRRATGSISLKVTRAGVLSRHRHTNPVHGYVLKGRWHYLEHDWVAEEGGYVYEPPGETHTLVVPDDVDEMITLFQVNGIMLYVDPDGNALGYEDVFSKIAMCRAHYEACGLGGDYVERFIR